MRQINLLPDDLKKTIKVNFIRNTFFFIFIPLLSVIMATHLLLSFQVQHLKAIAEEPPTPVDTPEIKELRDNMMHFKQEIVKFVSGNQPVVEHVFYDIVSSQMLALLAQSTSEKVWISHLAVDVKNNKCILEGKSFNTRLVSEFILELKNVVYFSEVDLITMQKADQSGKPSEISFQIECILK